MGKFLQAAYEVLKREHRAMSPEDITDRALKEGLLRSSGQTPAFSMRARLSTEILNRGRRSRFMRTDAGLFGLREWGAPEYVAVRHKKGLFDEDIVVFPRDVLWEHIDHIGLSTKKLDGKLLLSKCFPLQRRIAESDQSVIQLVSVFVVKHAGDFLTFKRTKWLPESRLHGFYSLHFGGHLNPNDVNDFAPLFDPFDSAQANAFLERELREELRLDAVPPLRYLGLLYDESREVSRQHLGVVFVLEAPSRDIRIGERGFLIDAKFEPRHSIRARADEFENWSNVLVKEVP
jgi:predicted NUDIX family phosphoesterase